MTLQNYTYSNDNCVKTLSVMTISIAAHYQCLAIHIVLSVSYLNVILSVSIQNVIMLSVIMLNVAAPMN